jgi:hypothetical protein
LFQEQEFSFCEQCADLVGAGAVGVNEEALATVGLVDDPGDRVRVGGGGGAEVGGYDQNPFSACSAISAVIRPPRLPRLAATC